MIKRRKFLQASLLSASGLASASSFGQASSTVPAVNSLLFDDESETIECADVAITEFTGRASYDGGGELTLLMDTPGGTRITADGAPADIDGQCNAWFVSGTQGGGNFDINFRLSDETVNTGRYPIFLKSSASLTDQFLNLRVTAGPTMASPSGDLSFMTNETQLIGSVNISADAAPVVRVLNVTSPA